MPRGQKGEFDAKSRLNGAPAVVRSWCSRSSQNWTKRIRPAISMQLAPDGCNHHAGVLVATSMLARTLRFNNYAGRKMRPREGDSRWTGYSEHRRS